MDGFVPRFGTVTFIPQLNGHLAQNLHQVSETKAKERIREPFHFFQMQLALRGHAEKGRSTLNTQNLWNVSLLTFVLYIVLTNKTPQQQQLLYTAGVELGQISRAAQYTP